MSRQNASKKLFGSGAPAKDPGDAGTITVDRSPHVVNLISATAETRTLARPTRVGAFCMLHHKTDGGDITLTVTGGFNEDGDTTFTFSDPGQFAVFISCYDGTNYFWRKIADYSTANLTPTEAGWLDGVTAGTGAASKVLVLDASGNVTMPTNGMLVLDRASVAAAGTNQATAQGLTAQINAVTGADGAKGVALPAAATTTGPILIVNTDSDAMLLVYPVNSGNDAINALTAGTGSYEMGPGEAAWFVPTSATQWYVRAADNNRNAEVVTAANVLTVEESGKVLFLNSATEFAHTLPPVASSKGVRYTFIVAAAPSGADYTVITDSSENKILGNVVTSQDAGGSADSEQTGGDTISFVSAKSVVGDRVDVYCDGSFWYATGFCKVFDAITITTAS